VNRIAAVSHYMTVAKLLRSGKVDEAVAQGEAAVALDPNSIRAHMALANAYAARHQAAEATREFHAATGLYEGMPAEFAKTVSPPVNPLVRTPSQ
jgi:Tfp pilus assembly protein PilF